MNVGTLVVLSPYVQPHPSALAVKPAALSEAIVSTMKFDQLKLSLVKPSFSNTIVTPSSVTGNVTPVAPEAHPAVPSATISVNVVSVVICSAKALKAVETTITAAIARVKSFFFIINNLRFLYAPLCIFITLGILLFFISLVLYLYTTYLSTFF